MPSIHEHRRNTASILTALGEIYADATPAEVDAAVEQALTDQRVEEASIRLLKLLGYDHAIAA